MKNALLLAVPCIFLGSAAQAQNYFTQQDIQYVSPSTLQIEVPGSCPRQNNDSNFANYPLNFARSHAAGTCGASSWTGGTVVGDLWVNRCTTSACTRSSPNPVLGATYTGTYNNAPLTLPVGLLYSTIDEADAATLAELDWWLGGSSWLSFTNAVNIPSTNVFTSVSTFEAALGPSGIQMQVWSQNGTPAYWIPQNSTSAQSEYVVMPNAQLGGLNGDPSGILSYVVELDYERADKICDISGGANDGQLGVTCQANANQDTTYLFLQEVSQLLQNTSPLGQELPHTWTFNVRGDELAPIGYSGYANSNSWQSGLDAYSIPYIMGLAGFNYYSVNLSLNGRYGSGNGSPVSDIDTAWEDSLSVVFGPNTTPQECSATMQHVMMDFDIQEPYYSNTVNGVTTVIDGVNYAQEANTLASDWCVPIVQADFTGNTNPRLGGPGCDNETPPQPELWPATWGALIGEPITCSGGRRVKR